MTVKQLRVVLNAEDEAAFVRALATYRDALGLPELAAFAGPDGAQVVILDGGRATLEVANPAQGRYIAEVETGGVPSTPVRLAFEVDDAASAATALATTGAEVVAGAVRTPWDSLNARLVGPEGLHLTLFQELHDVERSGLVGERVADLGGEDGVLARTVELAAAHGATGQRPFVALLARDGVVLGTGVDTRLADDDPTAHAEIAAVRDAARRTGSAGLSGAVIYSSCDPCPAGRAVAAGAGVREIVSAAGRDLLPPALTEDLTDPLTAALDRALPGQVRRGRTSLTADELAAPFAAFVQASG